MMKKKEKKKKEKEKKKKDTQWCYVIFFLLWFVSYIYALASYYFISGVGL